VKADFDDVQSLSRAFKGAQYDTYLINLANKTTLGCYGVYAVTDFFEAFEKETQQGINIVDAAKSTGIKHLIFSCVFSNVSHDSKLIRGSQSWRRNSKRSPCLHTQVRNPLV
jgi:hypothetical protein